ncbi:hypothetical protein MOO45_06915 [Bombilactobacillus folatiphilus]|uniref:CAAX prenyl protease 2/Lysostaphin resistance protein A-like domain-containing protein n=1 Tax=Bombilactobacillus folatiphilus TaxID=2923362 RepID=A0ABY4P8H9_9LACO|nr:CPBP family glutamic-type intramembrane protease [Bombilactobacillus folatiphilus]UQS81915.1 hypothetical protein MOO45_06915 [Bombilactobacillus folatiphilus]
MNALKSPTLSRIWYAIWIIMVVISQQLLKMSYSVKQINWSYASLFLISAVLFLVAMVARYRYESQIFTPQNPTFLEGVGNFFGLVAFTVVAIGLFLLIISGLKAKGRFPSLQVKTDYLARGTVVFWFELLASALLVAVEQQFVTTGFFFNYFWRRNNLTSALLGILVSGILYGILNMETFNFINFFIYGAVGCLLAIVYLATQNFRISVVLGIFVAILRVILI